MNRKLVMSFGGTNPAEILSQRELTWDEICARFAEAVPVVRDKADPGWHCSGEFLRMWRDAESFIARDLLSLDVDHTDFLFIDELLAWLEPYAHIVHTTFNHTDEAPRIRAILPLSRSCSYDEFQAVSRAVAARLDIEQFARESHVPTQMMYLPGKRSEDAPCWSRVSASGRWIDVDAVLQSLGDWRDRSRWPKRRDEQTIVDATTVESPLKKPGIVGAFCRAYRISEAIEVFDLPYDRTENPNRYTYRHGSRPEGAVIYDDDTKLHSHHDSDPAHGQHNAFDLVRLHRCGKLDASAARDRPITESPSHRAMCDLARQDKRVAKELGADDFADLGEEDPEPPKPEARVQVRFVAGRPLGTALDATREAIEAHAEGIGTAIYGNRYVRPAVVSHREGFKKGVPVETVELIPYEPNGFAAALGRRIDFVRRGKVNAETGKAELVKLDCPLPIAKAVLTTADLAPSIAIDRIALTPILIDDRLYATRGHNRELRSWLLCPTDFEPPQITDPEGQARAALRRVSEWLAEFPFATALDRSSAIAGLLTAAMRASIAHAPGFLVVKPDYGSGASTLCDLIHVVLAGRACSVINASKGRGEVDKELDSAQLAGLPALVIDNVVQGDTFNSVALAQSLSQPARQVRILGESRVLTVPCTQIALVNGNGVRIADDLVRRFLRIELNAHMENPHLRDFARPLIIQEARERRSALLADLYTLVLAYRAAGVTVKTQPLAGFQEWSESVAAPLVWLGLPDPTETQRTIAADDESRSSLREIMTAWRSAYGEASVTVRTIAEDEFPDGEAVTARAELRRLLATVAASPRGGLDAAKLGRWLTGVTSRVVGGMSIEPAGTAHGGVKKWRVAAQREDWLA